MHALAEAAPSDALALRVLGSMLARGANPNMPRYSFERETALHLAKSEETVRMLLHGQDPHQGKVQVEIHTWNIRYAHELVLSAVANIAQAAGYSTNRGKPVPTSSGQKRGDS